MLLALLLVAAPATSAKTLAVLELESKLPKDEIDVGYLADVVRTAAREAVPGLKVLAREEMLMLLNAGGKKLEECEGECEIEIGRRLGADLVISGEALQSGSTYKVDMKLHDTQTGELLSVALATGKDLYELEGSLNEAVTKLLAPIGATGSRQGLTEKPIPARTQDRAAGQFGFGAHASAGYYSSTPSFTPAGGTKVDGASSSSYMYGLGADAEYRFTPMFGVGPFVELMVFNFPGSSTTAASTANGLAFGALGRLRTGPLSFFLGLGYTNISDNNGSGGLLELGGDLAVAGPLTLRAALTYRAVSRSGTFNTPGGSVTGEASAGIVAGEAGLGLLF